MCTAVGVFWVGMQWGMGRLCGGMVRRCHRPIHARVRCCQGLAVGSGTVCVCVCVCAWMCSCNGYVCACKHCEYAAVLCQAHGVQAQGLWHAAPSSLCSLRRGRGSTKGNAKGEAQSRIIAASPKPKGSKVPIVINMVAVPTLSKPQDNQAGRLVAFPTRSNHPKPAQLPQPTARWLHQDLGLPELGLWMRWALKPSLV